MWEGNGSPPASLPDFAGGCRLMSAGLLTGRVGAENDDCMMNDESMTMISM